MSDSESHMVAINQHEWCVLISLNVRQKRRQDRRRLQSVAPTNGNKLPIRFSFYLDRIWNGGLEVVKTELAASTNLN